MIKITRKKLTQVIQRKMNFFDNKNSIKNDPWLRPRNFQVIEGRFEEVQILRSHFKGKWTILS